MLYNVRLLPRTRSHFTVLLTLCRCINHKQWISSGSETCNTKPAFMQPSNLHFYQETCSMHLVQLPIYREIYSKCPISLHCTTMTADHWQTYVKRLPLIFSNDFYTYCNICSSLLLVYSLFAEVLVPYRWDFHCNDRPYKSICLE